LTAHTDQGQFSFTLASHDTQHYSGGETIFPARECVVRPSSRWGADHVWR
ncbi:hypothetical protein BE221DRAFT_77750, partial [Ostreococcus tauri]